MSWGLADGHLYHTAVLFLEQSAANMEESLSRVY